MTATHTTASRSAAEDPDLDYDAIVIGAGFAGLLMLHELRQRGFSARVIEEAPEVGGTWYWNRYPGARTDSESWVYAYSFSKELMDEWEWSERFTRQPEALAYLKHVADRFDLRKDIQFDTKVVSAERDAQLNVWNTTTDSGEKLTSRYLISAVGPLSAVYRPDFVGLDEFEGEWAMTARWPETGIDLTDKRVAVIGTGATAVQLIPIAAHVAKELTVFQRTPNYVLPARNYVLTDEERHAIRTDYDAIWEKARNQFFGFPLNMAGRTAADVTPEEHQRILEWGWESGGFKFVFETFDDIFLDENSNEIASEFIRNKIRTIVKNPETAELLCPKDYPFVGKRPPLGHFYYETYNRENVQLVDVSEEPISRITAKGVQVGDTEYEADILIFATGFDAATGSITRIDIRGDDGTSVEDKWQDGAKTHLGLAVDGFPNMFMIFGPHAPFANGPVIMEGMTKWVGNALEYARAEGISRIEAEPEAVEQWGELLIELLNATVVPKGRNNYFVGANIPGKANSPVFFLGGAKAYNEACQAAAEKGYEGFRLT
ncbi:flavin-containing monooxygenase [Rhodococcus opacus]|uniref:flavin-containing monooxygenase n=1 Tax=Rhodococcus opacus TaxID=37919 RepID=UPI000EA9E5B9|nr:NAD(P)/FAD-dependent oxidoreductase [Rhodococcus opacus]QZS52747.1 NAD(P)/FAD-dependent oxidoreductase [Rhodococcus opacus]RKM65255.1 cyclohexanone monooxygenase [Rhodococcus opacus]